MRRTNPGDLAIPFLVIGLTAYVLLKLSYQDLPPLQYFTAVPIVVLALAEFVAARRVRAAVRHDPNAKPMAAIVIARCVALGKASSLVGSGLAGACVALLLRVLPEAGKVTAAASDARVGSSLLVGAAVLVVAGLVLERAGIDPNRDKRET
jgi:uncharacterized membrane protein YfcA